MTSRHFDIKTEGEEDLGLLTKTIQRTVRETLLQLQAVPPTVATKSPKSQRRSDLNDWVYHGRVMLARDHPHAEGWDGQPAPGCMWCDRVAKVLNSLIEEDDDEDFEEDSVTHEAVSE